MVRRQWGKLMLNVGLNQTVMVFEGRLRYGAAAGQAAHIMIAAMREVQKLRRWKAIPSATRSLTLVVRLADSLSPAGKPSMRQDGEAHRKSRSNLELFAGMKRIIRREPRSTIP